MKKILIVLLAIILVITGWFYFKPKGVGERTDGGSGSNSSVVIVKSEIGTTTPTYFTAGTTASSTKIISSDVYGKMAIAVCLTA